MYQRVRTLKLVDLKISWERKGKFKITGRWFVRPAAKQNYVIRDKSDFNQFIRRFSHAYEINQGHEYINTKYASRKHVLPSPPFIEVIVW